MMSIIVVGKVMMSGEFNLNFRYRQIFLLVLREEIKRHSDQLL